MRTAFPPKVFVHASAGRISATSSTTGEADGPALLPWTGWRSRYIPHPSGLTSPTEPHRNLTQGKSKFAQPKSLAGGPLANACTVALLAVPAATFSAQAPSRR